MAQWPRTASAADATMALVVVDGGLDHRGWGVDEVALDLLAQAGLVGFHGQEVVGSGLADGAGDDGIGGDGVDGDQGALEAATCGKPLEQEGDGGGLAAVVGDRLLAEHEPAGGGEGVDQVQGARVGLSIMTAPRGLAVDGDEIGALGPSLAHPGRERGREQLGIDAVHQLGEPARARHPVMVGQEAAQELEMCLAQSAIPS